MLDDLYSLTDSVVPSVVDQLHALGAQEGADVAAVLLAAFAILIYRYTRGETDLAAQIAFASSGAWHPSLIGGGGGLPREVALALRGDDTLREAIGKASDALATAWAEGAPRLAPERAGAALRVPPGRRAASGHARKHAPASAGSRDGSSAGDGPALGRPTASSVRFLYREPAAPGTAADAPTPFLSVSVRVGDAWETELSYRAFLSLHEPALQAGRHWRTLLAALGSHADTPISRLPLLDAEEEEQVLRAWRGEPFREELSRPECLHHLFEATARAHPERVALRCAGREMSYAELNRQADALARHLRSLGVARGSFVGIFLPRSLDVYVAMLGVLKAGAAYVPIDPEYPADRVGFILADCEAAALITTAECAARLSPTECAVVLVGRDQETIARETGKPQPESGVSPDDLAYMIYTSGSTGRPKGVQIEHRSVCTLVRAEGAIFHATPEDRVYQGFSVAFDASIEEIWLAFFSGATLVVGTHEMVHAGPALAGMLAAEGVTILSCVPTLLSMMDEEIPSLRLLILGGEACQKDLVTRWTRSGRRLVNSYGPTEATVIATHTDCRLEGPVTIGKAVPNYSLYILDEQMQPVPAGVPGELHIGGVALARGYLNRPDLTEEKFVANPFAGDPGAPERLYKSGDLVRFLGDGSIEFLGRIDAQVKLRGFRIELSEIESVLLHCPGVQSAVVAVREDLPGVQQLVAYVIPQQGREFDEFAAREVLRTHLPPYMMPAAFVSVESFPTLASGKADRKRLPAPALPDEAAAPRTGAVGRTEFERKILPVWEKLFHPQPVSLQDSFFDLGGHSLLAARMVSELRQHPEMRDVAMLDVYRHPELEAFAAHLEQRAAESRQAKVGPEAERLEEGPEPLPKGRGSFAACALAQIHGLYLVLGLISLPWLAPYVLYRYAQAHSYSIATYVGLVTGALFALFPAMVLVSVASKWVLIGRYRPGRHTLWGAYYWRFWLARRLQGLVPLSYLRGTPLLAWYYRLMGARIGANVYLGSQFFTAYDLIEIGDDSSIAMDAQVLGYTIEHGELNIAPITIGRRCTLGSRAVLSPGCVLEDDVEIGDLSLLPEGSRVPQGEVWSGSPAARTAGGRAHATPERAPWHEEAGYSLLYFLGVMLALPMVPLLAALPGGILLWQRLLTRGLGAGLLVTPLAVASFVVLLCAEITLAKRVLLPEIKPGRYPVRSLFYVRKWLVDGLMQMSLELLHSLYATLYLAPWFRTLGARLGRHVEVSTASHITTDLLEIGEGSFVADSACLGAPRVHLGTLEIAPTRVGQRTFIGNSALVPPNSAVGDGCLVGCLSTPPDNETLARHPGSSWMGSPSVRLPQRQASESFPEGRTFAPPWYLYLLRGGIEIFRVTLPMMLFSVLSTLLIVSSFVLGPTLGLAKLALLFPLLYLALALALVGVVVALKWAIVGRYRPCNRPLWSSFVWRNELITALHESFAAPFLLNLLQGTSFMSGYFRLMGSRIGRRVLWETTQITEFDLVHVGNDVCLNLNCTLQTHLFEDRVMKTDHLHVGDQCSLGTMAVALYSSTMKEGAVLNGLSLLMKGETLPVATRWEGIPARRATRHAPEPEVRLQVLEDVPQARPRLSRRRLRV